MINDAVVRKKPNIGVNLRRQVVCVHQKQKMSQDCSLRDPRDHFSPVGRFTLQHDLLMTIDSDNQTLSWTRMCSTGRLSVPDVCMTVVEQTTLEESNSGTFLYDAKSILSLWNIFWRANLTCHAHVNGDPKVKFDDLWHTAEQLSELLDCLFETECQNLALECCKFALRCGPVNLLQALFNNKLIDLHVNHTFDDGKSLLHYACLSSNVKAVAFLLSRGASLKIVDNAGQTPDQLCFCSYTRKELPSRYQTSLRMQKKQVASFEEKSHIFELVSDSESFEDLQIMLHTLEFDVNRDKDSLGNLLLHRAVRQGMSHLALVLNLVLVHQADVEATDNKGMTPLCIAAHLGDEFMVEVLMCVLGADPNAVCTLNHWTPLHFAAKKNILPVIECLVRRGADLNVEDMFGFRADDIAKKVGNLECQDVIENLRVQRCQKLSCLAKKGNLTPKVIFPSDIYTVDSEGLTLVMIAAKANRCDNLMVLLHNQKCPIDAQDPKFGQTALSLAAMLGKADAVQTLLRYDAHPGIGDIHGMLPLHHACLRGHVLCVQMIVNVSKGLTGLLEAMKYSDNPEICSIIQEATHRRQRNLVNPSLFECAMNGDADRLYSTLEEGDQVNPLTGTGDWPMYMAVGNRYIKVMQLLLANGGDFWSQHQTTGSTVLHIACSRGLYDIVSYLLWFSATTRKGCSPIETGDGYHCENEQLNIDAVNHLGFTALQVASTKGFSRIVKLLLSHGASSALVDSQGQLYKCCEFEGVQVLIEHHQRRRAEQIAAYIKGTRGVHQLIKVWQAKFDHNLRSRSGDTPLMVACLYGKVEAVKFLLRSAIQFVGKTDMSVQRRGGQNDCFVDSGAYDGAHPGCYSSPDRSLQTVDEYSAEMDTRSSVSNLSDQDDRSHESMKKQYNTHPSNLKGFSSSIDLHSKHVRRQTQFTKSCGFDSESLDDSENEAYAGTFNKHTDKSTVLYSQRAFSSSDIHSLQSANELSHKDQVSSRHGSLQTSSSRLFQGTHVNHLCAINIRDGCSAMHRAVECINERRGLEILLLLMDKDSSIINIQNVQGLSALHLAAKLEKAKIVKTLLSVQCINPNLRSSNGKLAEDMTRSKQIGHLIRDARQKLKEQSF
ncbi:ankyrin-3-like [Patiria miniata]|uniref:Uncharacterized protein n=1 Tax=Patiria miniata TaxID=46514 RepID=A0A913ZF26_PATMI|nr:ankyrin-3-like [Patiria miniata]